MSLFGCIRRTWHSLTRAQAPPSDGWPEKPKTKREKVLHQQRITRLNRLYKEATARREEPPTQRSNILPTGPTFMAKETTHRADAAPVVPDDGPSKLLLQHLMLDAALNPSHTDHFFRKDGEPEDKHHGPQDSAHESNERFNFDREEALNGYDSGHNMPRADSAPSVEPDRFSPPTPPASDYGAPSDSSYGGDSSFGSDTSSMGSGGGSF